VPADTPASAAMSRMVSLPVRPMMIASRCATGCVRS
jgi:hypothetical protein